MKRTFLVVLVTLFALFLSINKVVAQTGSGLDTLTQVNGYRLIEYAPGVTFAKTWFTNVDPQHGRFSQFFEVDRLSPNVADIYKYYAIFKKILPKRMKVASALPQAWLGYSHTKPSVSGYNEDFQFSIAFGKGAEKSSFSDIAYPNDTWKPTTLFPIQLDSIDCIYIRISGGFKETAVQIDYLTFAEYLGEPTFSIIEDFEDSTITDVERDLVIPTSYSLSQNYPNPFNPSTTISYVIPSVVKESLEIASSQVSRNDNFVSLKVFDLLGREIETLVSEEKSIGEHSVHFDGSRLASGTYFYQISIGHGQFVQTKKMILVK